jgi:monoamine oxidase
VTRALLDTKKPFWRDDKESGWARTDAPAELWDDGFGQSGGGLLSVTLSGAPDAAFASMNRGARIQRSVALASAAFPELRLQFQRGTVHRWHDEPFSKGAFAEFHPGQMTTVFPGIGAREERIHFAGEHTSSWMGWMEGALESGERAVREITET